MLKIIIHILKLLQKSVGALPLRSGHEFASRSLHVGFVVDETEPGQVLHGVSSFKQGLSSQICTCACDMKIRNGLNFWGLEMKANVV